MVPNTRRTTLTEDEAKTVGYIALEADGGCWHCARSLIDMLISAFPEHEALFDRLYREEFDAEVD